MPQQHDPNGYVPPRRHGCTYKMHCDDEATTTVVINGNARAVCESCRRWELTIQNTERARAAEREASA